MTFEQLECFIYAVQENTFFDAEEALHITQSSLSKQIKKMEQELTAPYCQLKILQCHSADTTMASTNMIWKSFIPSM